MSDLPRIAGVVLAAGRSSRMGAPKALLRLEGETFLGQAIRTLKGGGCREVVAVVPEGEGELARVARDGGARIVVNADPHSEPIDSLRAALASLDPAVEGVLVTPVDVPGVRTGTVRAILAGFADRLAPVVLPRYRGVRGHPTLFSRATFAALRDPRLEEGAREVVRSLGAAVREVEVSDPAVVRDVDTPEAYGRLADGA
jgi:molybdenum cofactor cytidylyltransferase